MFDKIYDLLNKLEDKDLLYALVWISLLTALVFVLAGCGPGRLNLEAIKIEQETYNQPAKETDNAKTNKTD